MSDFDEVLHRIQNQLDKMKKSLGGRNRDRARVTTAEDPRNQKRGQSGGLEKNLPVEPLPKPPHP